MVKFCEWPALYSIAITLLTAGSLIYAETSVGNKIASLSITQQIIILLVICIVAKNVFIQSRANRFMENSVSQNASVSSAGGDNANGQKSSKKQRKSKKVNSEKMKQA